MKQEETPETTRPKINSERLNELIKSPTIGLLQEKGKTICFEGYDIEDEYIILNHTLEININLTFENCSFKGNNALGIDGLICHGEVKFENCNFESGVYLIDGTFKKELSFKCIESDKIWLLGGNYETIHISGYTIDEIDIMGGQFQLLEIGGFPIDRDIKKLSIRDRGHKLGNINVSQQNYTKISIGGLNDGNTYDFKDVKSNTVSISNFINEGYLNFYGMEPKDPDDELRYFHTPVQNKFQS